MVKSFKKKEKGEIMVGQDFDVIFFPSLHTHVALTYI